VVTLCTIRLNFKYYVLLTECIKAIWKFLKTAIIILCAINILNFITQTGCVHCAVRTVSLTTIQANLSLQISQCSTLIFIHMLLPLALAGRRMGTFQKAMHFRKSGSIWQKSSVTNSYRVNRAYGVWKTLTITTKENTRTFAYNALKVGVMQTQLLTMS
jgi:hypothetical protein